MLMPHIAALSIGNDEESAAHKFKSSLDEFMKKYAGKRGYQKRLHKLLADAPMTDLGNALRVYARYGYDLRYVAKWDAWILYNGSRWAVDADFSLLSKVQDMTQLIAEEARAVSPAPLSEAEKAQLTPEKAAARELASAKAKALFKWSTLSQSARATEAAIKQLRGVPGVTITHESLDALDTLLNTPSGTLDLMTLQLQKHCRDDLLTKQTTVEYRPGAVCPNWLNFIDKVTSGDTEKARYLQQLVGMGLTGRRIVSILPIFYGSGGNGKSVFIEVLKELLGDYAGSANSDLFIERPNGSPTNDIARLVGIRFLSAEETREGAPLNEALVKALTGGGTYTARFLHKEFFEFLPKFTPFLSTNHKPTIKNTDNGIWRRLRLISWKHDFTTDPDSKPFEEVITTLRSEHAGILCWAVAGLQDVLINGLIYPESVKADTELYKAESDLIGDFLQEKIIPERGAELSRAEMYSEYQQYMKETGHNSLSTNRFTPKLREKNLEEYRRASGRGWLNVRIRTADDSYVEEPRPAAEPVEVEVF